MATSLSIVGLFWAVGSFFAAVAACFGYFMPYWLTGAIPLLSDTTTAPIWTTFGTFRRCGYSWPSLVHSGLVDALTSTVEYNSVLTKECGRYQTFSEIPSVWWQVTTVVTGVGCCGALLVAFAALLCCCISDVMSQCVAGSAFVVQFLAGACVAVGCVLYPMGWNSRQVRHVCGETADRFNPGACNLSWAYWTTIGGAFGIITCSFLAINSAKRQGGYQRAPVIRA